MSDLFQNKYRIPSTRFHNWDYSQNGYYFVTICTNKKQEYFGEIAVETPKLGVSTNRIKLSKMGTIAHKYWQEIPIHFPFIKLDEFVVMPNHIHGIIIIANRAMMPKLDMVETPKSDMVETPKLGVSTVNTKKWQSGCLGVIINQFKRICTMRIRHYFPQFAWQSRYYDHIIRNEESYLRIIQYIKNNPNNWETDRNYSGVS